MKSMRPIGSGLLYALVSVVLVVGGLSLALAEGRLAPAPPTAKPSPTLPVPSSTAVEVTPTRIVPATVVPSVVPSTAPSDTPRAIVITATRPLLSSTASPRPFATSTRSYYATAVHCGPYAGWLKNYTVKQGDTLFHISTLYQTTVQALQTANCLPNYLIVPGQVLWVPNVPTITPGVTIVVTLTTATATPTLPLTLTPLPYYTETAVPTLPLTATPPTPGP